MAGVREGDKGDCEMKTAWFTFGQAHAHSVNGKTFDRNCVVEITAEDPRQVMFDTFQNKWAFEYDKLEDVHLEHFPRGIIKL